MGLFSRRRAPSSPGASSPEEVPPPARITELTDETFLEGTEGGITVVDFWADWCRPCHAFAPTFEHAARLHGDRLRFARLDVEVARRTAGMVGVQSIPTVVVFGPDGSELMRAAGALQPRQLESLLSRASALADQRL